MSLSLTSTDAKKRKLDNELNNSDCKKKDSALLDFSKPGTSGQADSNSSLKIKNKGTDHSDFSKPGTSKKPDSDRSSKNNNEDNSHSDYSKPGTSRKSDSSSQSIKKNEHSEQSTIERIKPKLVIKEKVSIPDPSEDIFQDFVSACKKRKSDDSTLKILSKLHENYDKLDGKFKNNDEFRIFLCQNMQKISTGHNDKFYSYIKEVNDEIKRRIIKPKKSKIKETNSNHDSDQNSNHDSKKNEDSNFKGEVKKNSSSKPNSKDEVKRNSTRKPNSKDGVEKNNTSKLNDLKDNEEEPEEILLSKEDRSKLKKIEKAIIQCKEKIKELEQQEVDFDEDDNSAYIKEDRYKRKLVQLCHMYSQIGKDKLLKEEILKKQLKRKDIPGEMTGIPEADNDVINLVNQSIKKINKLKHISNPSANPDYLKVPDYQDIFQLVKKYNEVKDLDWSAKKMEARGKFLSMLQIVFLKLMLTLSRVWKNLVEMGHPGTRPK